MRRAIDLLGDEVVAVSTFRETDPVGYEDQPRFLNAAVAFETDAGAARAARPAAGGRAASWGARRDGPRYGPRTIDLDLLVYGDEVVDEPGLRVPHPRLAERRFVLEPLFELDPGLVIHALGPVSALLAGLE